jgi:membrane dipeptidase
MLIFDAHLDLAMNALEWNRDLTRPVAEIRACEQGMTDKRDRGNGTVSLPEMRRGGVGLCVATLFSRCANPSENLEGWNGPEIAWSQAQGQLAWYRAMEQAGEMVAITDAASLSRHVSAWNEVRSEKKPIGYVLSIESADPIITPQHLGRFYEQGVRAIGPAHYGAGRYAHGTHASGGLRAGGRELLGEMERLGIILDASHFADESFWEALEAFSGRVWASHTNCRAIAPDQRQFSDEQIRALLERGAVIGVVFHGGMLVPGWINNQTRPEEVGLSLNHVIDHIDHICQLAGNAKHVGLGTDLDGGFGREKTPTDVDTIADLARLPDALAARGYSQSDIGSILHGNWIRFLIESWRT